LKQIIFEADHSLIMQTPYLLFSGKALRGFKRLRKKSRHLKSLPQPIAWLRRTAFQFMQLPLSKRRNW